MDHADNSRLNRDTYLKLLQNFVKILLSEMFPVELMMDNHKCIIYNDVQYYVPEDNLSNEEEEIYEFLIKNYLW